MIILVMILTGKNVTIMIELCMFSEVSSLPPYALKAEIDEIIWQLSRESQLIPINIKDMEYLYEESVILKRRFFSIEESTFSIPQKSANVISEILGYPLNLQS